MRCNEVQDGAQDSEWIHFGGRSRRNWGNASGSSTDWSNAAEVTGPVRAGRSPPNPSPVSSLPPTHTSVSTSKRTSFRWTRRRLRDVTSMDRPSLLTIVFLDHSHVYGIHFFFGKYIRSLLSPLNRWWRDRFWSNRSSTGHDQALSVRWGPIQETLGVTNKESMKIKAVIIGFNNRLILTVVSPMNYVSRQCIGGEFFFTHFELVALLVKNGGGGVGVLTWPLLVFFFLFRNRFPVSWTRISAVSLGSTFFIVLLRYTGLTGKRNPKLSVSFRNPIRFEFSRVFNR